MCCGESINQLHPVVLVPHSLTTEKLAQVLAESLGASKTFPLVQIVIKVIKAATLIHPSSFFKEDTSASADTDHTAGIDRWWG